MNVNQFGYKQNRGTMTIFKAETEREQEIIDTLKSLIADETGVLSRKAFSFDADEMTISMDKRVEKPVKPTKPETAKTEKPVTPNKTKGGAKSKAEPK